MKNARMLRNLTLIVAGIVCAMAPAYGQSSAQGKLNVQAVVQGSVALVNVDGEWKVIVANAPDPVETHASLQTASQHRALAQSQKITPAPIEQTPVSDRAQMNFSNTNDDAHRGY
jgi:hypothetical protein